MRRRALVALAAALLAGVLFHVWREYPPLLAGVLGAAVGALVFSVQRTVDRLREMSRR